MKLFKQSALTFMIQFHMNEELNITRQLSDLLILTCTFSDLLRRKGTEQFVVLLVLGENVN